MSEPLDRTGPPLNPPPALPGPDSWAHLRQYTSARIALGRSGGSVRTATLLDFRLDHARARDAVWRPFSGAALAARLAAAGWESLMLATAAADRSSFLVRPDLGRRLSADARAALIDRREAWGERDLAVIVSDGLSAAAAERQVAPILATLGPLLRSAEWTVYPVLIAPFGRVKLQDEIGEILGARHTLMLLGERPGLGSPDSLGAYFTFRPRAACSDADRNCVSNIRPEGLPPVAAAAKLAQLLRESARRQVSGVALKDLGASAELPR